MTFFLFFFILFLEKNCALKMVSTIFARPPIFFLITYPPKAPSPKS
jgi:hypothetical protein